MNAGRVTVRRIRRTKDVTQAAQEDRLARKAEAELAGLYEPDRPADVPSRIPRDITSVDDKELMALFGEMLGWTNYHSSRLARAQVEEKYAESVLEVRRASAVLSKKSRSVTESKAIAEADAEVQDAQQAYLAAYEKRKIEEAAYNNAERLAQLLSRELTRRVGRNDRENRGNRWMP